VIPIKRIIMGLLLVSLLLGGCSGGWLDGSYHSKTPHKEQSSQIDPNNMSAFDYTGLLNALGHMVMLGEERGIISVQKYKPENIERDMEDAIDYTMQEDPFGAYAVESIHYELGSSAARPAIAVTIQFRRNQEDIRKIKTVQDLADITDSLATALKNCDSELVLHVNEYMDADFVQMADNYASMHPDVVMEQPEIVVNTYPAYGTERILEVKFIYQTSREVLRSYQQQVSRIFSSAMLYVDADAAESDKISQLYTFLMQLEDYSIVTSITPAYSLLRQGQGDSKAFATVFAAMCREAGLGCQVVTGTRWGEAWCWNMVKDETGWHHVDIILCSQGDGLVYRADAEMEGYVWDYEAYPTSNLPEPTEPAPTEVTE
jgi:hypothetical protein